MAKAAVVFGAAGGIGGAIAAAQATAGWAVLGADLAAKSADGVPILRCDAAVDGEADRVMREARGQIGAINGVVHSIGITAPGPAASMQFEDWQRVLAVNLTSAFLIARAAHAHLRETGGSLLMITSSSARDGGSTASGPAYAASKAGMAGLMRYLAKEWAGDGIRVNAIAPGPVMTPMMAAASIERQQAYAQSMLTRALAEPEEIAALAAFLLSPAARSMTGAVLNQSGGLVLD